MASEINESNLAAVRQSAKLSSSMPEIEYEITAMEATAQNKVFQALRSGKLTPDMAMNFVMELYSYSRLRLRLKEKASISEQYIQKLGD